MTFTTKLILLTNNMPDVKFDIVEFVKTSYFIPAIIAILAGLICYRYLTSDWWWIVVIGIIVFLMVIFLMYMYNVHRRKRYIKGEIKAYDEKRKAEKLQWLRKHKDEVKSFFLTLEDYDLEAITELYKYEGIPTGYSNERIVKADFAAPGEGKVYTKPTAYICVLNVHKYDPYIIEIGKNQGTKRHIRFDLFLYALIENYVKTGKMDYPDGMRLDDYLKYFKD